MADQNDRDVMTSRILDHVMVFKFLKVTAQTPSIFRYYKHKTNSDNQSIKITWKYVLEINDSSNLYQKM